MFLKADYTELAIKYLLAMGLGVFYHYGVAQYTLPLDPLNRKIVPPSPEAWAFNQYGEYPVSQQTGVPSIEIPIYTAVVGDLSVPVSLSYHASGIKVDDISSPVGLGWNLNANGIISRATRGIRDESSIGLLFHGRCEF